MRKFVPAILRVSGAAAMSGVLLCSFHSAPARADDAVDQQRRKVIEVDERLMTQHRELQRLEQQMYDLSKKQRDEERNRVECCVREHRLTQRPDETPEAFAKREADRDQQDEIRAQHIREERQHERELADQKLQELRQEAELLEPKILELRRERDLADQKLLELRRQQENVTAQEVARRRHDAAVSDCAGLQESARQACVKAADEKSDSAR